MRPEGTKCPHANVVHCPLYAGAHVGGGPSCDDGHLDTQLCAVDRGVIDYRTTVEALRAKHPRLVAECEFYEAAAQSKEQRDRNLRLNGVH